MKKAWGALGCLLMVSAVAVVGDSAPPVGADGALTLPFLQSGIAVGSWFDHTSPATGAGLTDNSSVMTRYDDTTGWSYNGHAGIDFSLPSSSNVVAATDGTVQFVGWENPLDTTQGFGFYVRVLHASLGHSTLYGHMDGTYLVANGDYVPRGTVIGRSGNTGHSDAAHLHFGVYNSQAGWTPVDPYGWSGPGNGRL